jgi:hypothetical protein
VDDVNEESGMLFVGVDEEEEDNGVKEDEYDETIVVCVACDRVDFILEVDTKVDVDVDFDNLVVVVHFSVRKAVKVTVRTSARGVDNGDMICTAQIADWLRKRIY